MVSNYFQGVCVNIKSVLDHGTLGRIMNCAVFFLEGDFPVVSWGELEIANEPSFIHSFSNIYGIKFMCKALCLVLHEDWQRPIVNREMRFGFEDQIGVYQHGSGLIRGRPRPADQTWEMMKR